MYGTDNLIQRALALAATGDYRTATGVRTALQAEGFPRSMIQPLFEGAAFLKSIRAILKAAPKKDEARPDPKEAPDPGADAA